MRRCSSAGRRYVRPLPSTGDGGGTGLEPHRGIVFWLWHPRSTGREAGEFALVDGDARSTERSEAVRQTAADVERLMPWLRDAHPLPPAAAILYSRDSMILYQLEAMPWRGGGRDQDILLSLIGCHRMLAEAHVPVQFIDGDGAGPGGNGSLQAALSSV